jgi:hypothetical protein
MGKNIIAINSVLVFFFCKKNNKIIFCLVLSFEHLKQILNNKNNIIIIIINFSLSISIGDLLERLFIDRKRDFCLFIWLSYNKIRGEKLNYLFFFSFGFCFGSPVEDA